MNNLCLDCHQEIRWLVQRGRGLHATDPGAACSTCHPDHAGRDFEMIKWPEGSREQFDHRRTGWPLELAHAEVKCLDCHAQKFRSGEAARLSPGKGGAVSWVGLERDCVSCHEDVHRKSLNTRCEVCHDTREWKFARRFDHANSRYPLTGAHVDVRCEACHKPPREGAVRTTEGTLVAQFKPLPFAQCSACHQDPHSGRLGTRCDDCHNTRGFKLIGKDQFNHERTRYPLRGRHIAVACTGCHDPASPRQWSPPFASCGSCHRDAHGGQATLGGKPADCAACHTVAGFRPGAFTLAQHRATRYPLLGKHAEVTCGSCHVRRAAGAADSLGSARVVMRPASQTCRSCHGDDHGSQLAGRQRKGACEECHDVGGWRPATFTSAAHNALRVTLEGKHGTLACAACHGAERKGLPPLPGRDSLGKAGVAIQLPSDCVSCHVDPHQGRFSRGGQRPHQQECVGCHSYQAFRPSTVDVAAHQSFGWKLEGAHRAVPCASCHEESKKPPMPSTLVREARAAPALTFTVKGTDCATCHTTPHGDQFAARSDKGACASCHTVEAFKPAGRFNHNRDAAFSLEGAHAQVSCEKCHSTERSRGGEPMVRYRPLATRCESCHLEAPNARPTR